MIFPDWGTAAVESGEALLPLYTEWAMDWEGGAFALRDGKPYTVTGDEALRSWVRCALHPESCRFLCTAHTPAYGNQLALYLADTADQGILESLLAREIRETLLFSPYIRRVDGFTFERSGSLLTAYFRVRTVYGDFQTDTEVTIA